MTLTPEEIDAIADSVWNRLTTALTTVGSIGALLVSKLPLIRPEVIVIQSPVAEDLTVTTRRGDDYLSEDGRQLLWVIDGLAVLTGGTVAVTVEGLEPFVGEVQSEDAIALQLTRLQTATIPEGVRRYRVVLTQSVVEGGEVITIATGPWVSLI